MIDALDAHLNVQWLRPESALWDAIAADRVSQFPLPGPSLDLGCGNGVFSYLTAGGDFSSDYDWYLNANPEGFRENRDIYDTFTEFKPEWRTTKPQYTFTVGADRKPHLLKQAAALGLYERTLEMDANQTFPFVDGAFQSVFCNMLYWLESPERAFAEIHRMLRPGGSALLCLQDPIFKEYCPSYHLESPMWTLLNRGRAASHLWTVTYDELKALVSHAGLTLQSHEYYLSPLTLKVWDIGLRPLSSVLLKMVGKLDTEARREIKAEWIATVRPFVEELFDMEQRSTERGGYHLALLEKR